MDVEVFRNTPERSWTYQQLDRHQREVAERVRAGEPGRLILSELAPVITYGPRTPDSDFGLGREEYERRGVEILKTDRGGLATYHGPGQWVVFPTDSLERLTGSPRGVRKAVDLLLNLALRVAHIYRSDAEIRDGKELGVWLPEGKLASVGIRIERGVLLHGLALNGYPTPTSFLGIRPCGLDAQPAFLLGSRAAGPGRHKEFEELGQALMTEFLKTVSRLS